MLENISSTPTTSKIAERTQSPPTGHLPRYIGARSDQFRKQNVEVRSGYVESYDGQEIFYCVEGKGEPLVFVYGIGCSTLHWTYQLDYFSQNYQVIWLDYRGHRKSPAPLKPNTLTLESFAKDIKAVVDHLGVQKHILLGHSMGASVALEYARQFPESLKALVLANGTPKTPFETLMGGNFLTPAFKIFTELESARPDWTSKIWEIQKFPVLAPIFLGSAGFNRKLASHADIEAYAQHMSEMNPSVFAQLAEDYGSHDSTPWLHKIKTKSLVLSGEKDIVTPPQTQQLMAQLLPNSRLVKIPHGSHCSTLDLPELVNLEIQIFLNEMGIKSNSH